MATEVYKDSTSHSYFFELVDSTTGLPKTGVVYSAVTGSYARTRGDRVAITMATLASASAAWSSGGFILVDDTNQPGVYRFDVPDAAFATGVDEVVVTLKATGCRTQSRAFTLININKQTAKVPATIAAGDIATDAIDANSLKADAVAEIQNGLATSTAQTTAQSSLTDIKAKTDNLPSVPFVHTLGKMWALDGDGNAIGTADSQTTILNRIGAFTGTGVNTILGFFKALLSKTATVPSDVGGTFDPSTDSTEAIRERGDSAWATATGFSTLDGDQVAAAVLNATAADYDTTGSIGEKINSSGAASDPLENAVPGSYAAGTAGFALGEVAAVRVLGPIGSTVTRPGEVLPGETIVAYHYAPVEAGPILVTDEDGEPIDLSSYATDLAIVIFSTNGVTETKIGQINYPNVTVGGTGNNQVSFSGSSALTVTIGRFRYGLRRRTSGAKFVRAQGEFIVYPMADVT